MKKLGLLAFSVLLTSCATSYGENSFWNDGGFSETEIQPNVFNVRFKGNISTSLERVSNFSMLRAAELCLARGMQYMELFNISTQSVASGYIPSSSTTTVSATVEEDSAYSSSTTIFNPGETLYSSESGLTASCFANKTGKSWDALFLERSLKTKYEIE